MKLLKGSCLTCGDIVAMSVTGDRPEHEEIMDLLDQGLSVTLVDRTEHNALVKWCGVGGKCEARQ